LKSSDKKKHSERLGKSVFRKERLGQTRYFIMKTIILLLSISFFSWIGWWLGGHIGLMTGYLAGFVGSLVGVVVGVRCNQNYLG
jgi:hypothetical protein